MTDRPSFLRVDRAVLSGDRHVLGTGDRELDAHIAWLQADHPVPPWVEALHRPRRPRWWLASFPIALAAAALLWFARLPPYEAAKGDASLEVVLAEGPWDGRPLHAGDRIRVRVHGWASPYVAVVWREADLPPVLVAAGPTPPDGVLPGAWALDADPRDVEIVAVGLARDPAGMTAAAILAAAQESAQVRLDAP